MSLRPTIFVSAVSKELKSARQLVATTLTFLGYEPIWQDIFGTEQGDLRGMLRRQIDQSKGVVQLVGKRYGAEPPVIDEKFGRVSYTQYEALYAKQQDKEVWYLVLDETFPTDTQEAEAEELQKLQATYRRQLKTESQLRYSLGSHEALKISVHELRKELEILRVEYKEWVRAQKRWAAAVVSLLIILVAVVITLRSGQRHLEEQIVKMQEGIPYFPGVQNQIRQERPGQNAAELQEHSYERWAREQGVTLKVAQEKLPQIAREMKSASNATAFERANAAYVLGEYAEAEQLALVVTDESQGTAPAKLSQAIKALELAGYSADARLEHPEALRHFRNAEKLTDQWRDPLRWAEIQRNIAFVLDELGEYAEAEKVYRGALEEYRNARGERDPGVLALRNNLAVVLNEQGRHQQAELELREVVNLENEVLGSQHPATLMSRMNLANSLLGQDKFADAEAEYRGITSLEEKIFGPEHAETLANRNNLALTHFGQGKYAVAHSELSKVIRLEEKKLGPEHPQTLASRNSLAAVLEAQGKWNEAEEEARSVIRLREAVLPPLHPDILDSRNNLSLVLNDKGKYGEAEMASRKTLSLDAKVISYGHPYRLDSRHQLAVALCGQGKYAEAETEFKTTVEAREKILVAEHHDTLSTYYDFALCLETEGKMEEAEALAHRAADAASRKLGTDHPDTLKYERLLRELETKKQ